MSTSTASSSQIRQSQSAPSSRTALIALALQRCPALLMLDHRDQVIFRSDAATEVLKRFPQLTAEPGQRLGAPLARRLDRRLADYRSALRFAAAHERPTLLIDDPEHGELCIRAESAPEVASDCAWILHLNTCPSQVRICNAYLVQRYGLTSTEAALAAALSEGASPAQFALRQRSSISTVRTQLRQVFQKLGVRNQAGVLRRLLSDPAARRGG